jgi:hypothetical protein
MDKRQLIGLKCKGLDLQKVKKFNEFIQFFKKWMKGS